MFLSNAAPPIGPFSLVFSSGIFIPPLLLVCVLFELIAIWRLQQHVNFWRILITGSLINLINGIVLFVVGLPLVKPVEEFSAWSEGTIQSPFNTVLLIGVWTVVGVLGNGVADFLLWIPFARRWRFLRTLRTILIANAVSHLAWLILVMAYWLPAELMH